MHDFQSLKTLIEQEIALLKLEGNPPELYDPIRYSLALKAKRVRPMLALAATELFGGDLTKALRPALGIEVFHNFTLLHDDIMDNAPIRRSKPTVHVNWGVNVAILSGDAMFIKACELVTETESKYLKPVLDLFYTTALQVCEGQQLDMNFEKQENTEIVDYMEMIRLKTAVLLAGSLKMGAIMAGASNENAEKIYSFGENIGLAFQLRDDLLDVYGASIFGKRMGGDILANKKTFMLLKALDTADETMKKALHAWMNGDTHNEEDKIRGVTQIFNTLKIKNFAEKEIDFYFKKGLDSLESVSCEKEKKTILFEFAESLMEREV
jgi:geranylgeranyl diphosphate synthase type II